MSSSVSAMSLAVTRSLNSVTRASISPAEPPILSSSSTTRSMLGCRRTNSATEATLSMARTTPTGEPPVMACKSRSLSTPTTRSSSTTTRWCTPWRLIWSRASKA